VTDADSGYIGISAPRRAEMKNDLEGLLAGVRVLDRAEGPAGFCSRLLADLGATVVKIESPEEDLSCNRQSFQYHNRNKLIITLNLKYREDRKTFDTLVRNADLLVDSSAAVRSGALQSGYEQLRHINPRLIHISITVLGQTGPKRMYRSCDSIQAALGGQMHRTRDSEGKPLKLAGAQSFYVAALFGANAVILALRQRSITGLGRHIDLAIQEAVSSTLGHVMIDHFLNAGMREPPAEDLQAESFFTLPCKDGYIAIPLMRNSETILELANLDATPGKRLGDEWKDAAYRNRHWQLFRDSVARWTEGHTKNRLFKLGQAMGFPWAPVLSHAEVLRNEQLRARRFFMRTAKSGRRGARMLPGLPYKLSSFSPGAAKSAPPREKETGQVLHLLDSPKVDRLALHDRESRESPPRCEETLRGIRVLDFTRMLSGPYATRILGDFGAEVIKVQSRLTASGAERNDSPYFGAWNRNKRSIGLNMSHPQAREILLDLASISDIVIENFSPRVMANWQLTYRDLQAVKPDLIMVSVSAVGQTGPWRNCTGFAETFHALSGLMHDTSRSRDLPVSIGFAYGDVIAGLYASLAVLVFLEHRDRTGEGQYVDLSAYEALCTLPNFDDEESWGCYPCAGKDRWCVISIPDEAGWRKFCRIADLQELKCAPFSAWRRKGRKRSELDRRIAQWTANFAADSIVRRLQRAGVAAAAVQSAEDLANDPHLKARNFFIHLNHPKAGMCFADRSALWPWNEDHQSWKAAPELGEANHYVFVDLLGHSETEYKKMTRKGILEHG